MLKDFHVNKFLRYLIFPKTRIANDVKRFTKENGIQLISNLFLVTCKRILIRKIKQKFKNKYSKMMSMEVSQIIKKNIN